MYQVLPDDTLREIPTSMQEYNRPVYPKDLPFQLEPCDDIELSFTRDKPLNVEYHYGLWKGFRILLRFQYTKIPIVDNSPKGLYVSPERIEEENERIEKENEELLISTGSIY
jgi:hypothetical protein